MGRMVSIEWVEMFPTENIKLGQGGRRGKDPKGNGWGGPGSSLRRFVCSSERLKIRKTAGARLSFFASSLGIGADTSTSVDLVISDAAVNISSRMSSWLVRFCASPSKGWARSLPPLCCSHSAAKSMSMCSKTAVGYASWTGGSGPAVYLSRALRGVNLPAGTLFLLAAASRQFLVDEGMSMGGRTGMKLFGVAPFRGWRVGVGWRGGAVSLMGVRMRRGAGGMGTSVGDMLVREGYRVGGWGLSGRFQSFLQRSLGWERGGGVALVRGLVCDNGLSRGILLVLQDGVHWDRESALDGGRWELGIPQWGEGSLRLVCGVILVGGFSWHGA